MIKGGLVLKKRSLMMIILAAVVFTGCAGPMIGKQDSNKVLVYGFMNIKGEEDEPYKMWIQSFKFRKVDPPSNEPDFYSDWMLGTLFFVFLDPGFYRLEEFKARGLMAYQFLIFKQERATIMTYQIPVQGNGFKFEKPGLYYFGTYEIINGVQNVLEESSFNMKRAYYPSEEDLIVRLLEETEKGCYWEGVLKKRLSQLRQRRKLNGKIRKNNAPPI